MISKYLRDGNEYSQEELCNILECKTQEVKSIIHRLIDFKVLKLDTVSASKKEFSALIEDKVDAEYEGSVTNSSHYTLNFVGIIVVANRVLKCYPKYILNQSEPKEHLRIVLKVLEKYKEELKEKKHHNKSKEQHLHMFSDFKDNSSFNSLAVIIFLLSDYYTNGTYSNSMERIECNGEGEILWDKTINDSIPVFFNKSCYYLNLKTRKKTNDNNDYFKRLHECILSSISTQLKNADLLELFNAVEINLSDESLQDFGDENTILYRIENELNRQFNSRKQLVLKALYSYIKNHGSIQEIDAFSLFGTTKFEHIWQAVCNIMMRNQYDMPLKKIKLPLSLNKEYNPNDLLKDVIEKPFWSAAKQRAKNSFNLDLISIVDEKFIISDAKYYVPVLCPNEPLAGQPGIEDVAKQYLYQLAFKKFIKQHGLKFSGNFFLMPTEAFDFIYKGTASLNMLSNLGLDEIHIIFVPADKAYDYYLSGKPLDIQQFLGIPQQSLS